MVPVGGDEEAVGYAGSDGPQASDDALFAVNIGEKFAKSPEVARRLPFA